MPAMPPRSRNTNKVTKTAAGSRCASRNSSLSVTAQEHLERFAQQSASGSNGSSLALDAPHLGGSDVDVSRSHSDVDADGEPYSPIYLGQNTNLNGEGGHQFHHPRQLENMESLSTSHVSFNGTSTIASSFSSRLQHTLGPSLGAQAADDIASQNLQVSDDMLSSTTPDVSAPTPPASGTGAGAGAGTGSATPTETDNFLTAAEVAVAVYGDEVRIDSVLCRKLADEVAVRDPVQRRSDQKLNIERRSNVEALLAHITGEAATRACKNCRKGHGPWTQCIIYQGQMCGSCTNCWFNASGSRCTFHENNNPNPTQTYVPPPIPVGAPIPEMATQNPARSISSLSTPLQIGLSAIFDDFGSWGLAEPTRRLVTHCMSDMASMNRNERFIARIEAAAKELGMRIAEYEEFLGTPEGMLVQQEVQHYRRSHSHGPQAFMETSHSPEE